MGAILYMAGVFGNGHRFLLRLFITLFGEIPKDDLLIFPLIIPYRLFVEEPDAIFTDEMPRYQNKRMLLNDDPLIEEFINTCEEFDKALAQINPGQYGYVTETPELMLIRLKRDNLQREIRQKYP